MTNQTRTWQDLDLQHHMHPFTGHVDLEQVKPQIMVRGEGVYIYDSEGQHPDKASRSAFAPLGSISNMVRNQCFKNGLVTRAVGDGLVFSPPLIITRTQVDELVAKLKKSLDDVYYSAGRQK